MLQMKNNIAVIRKKTRIDKPYNERQWENLAQKPVYKNKVTHTNLLALNIAHDNVRKLLCTEEAANVTIHASISGLNTNTLFVFCRCTADYQSSKATGQGCVRLVSSHSEYKLKWIIKSSV